MIDTLMDNVEKARKSSIMSKLSLTKKNFALVTLHRPSNVDSKESLRNIFTALNKIQKKIPVIFPIHPRTRKNLKRFFSKQELLKAPQLKLLEPLGYLDFLNLMMHAKLVMTDSGGIQEETTVLGVPCLTIRETTERPITITEGTNILTGMNKNRILRESQKILQGKQKKGRCPRYWDGKAAERIVKNLLRLKKEGRLLR